MDNTSTELSFSSFLTADSYDSAAAADVVVVVVVVVVVAGVVVVGLAAREGVETTDVLGTDDELVVDVVGGFIVLLCAPDTPAINTYTHYHHHPAASW